MIKKIGATGFLKPKPLLQISPSVMSEEGLSKVEEHCLLEIGYSAGAKKVEVHV